MSISGVVAVLLQVSALGLFIIGGLYLFVGEQRTAAERIPLVIAAALGVLLLLAFAEIINILADTRTAAERTSVALERLAERRSQRDTTQT